MNLTRRELLGWFRRPVAPEPTAPPPGREPAPPARRAPRLAMIPRVRPEACLATTSFCSVCVERCPRPGAIVVEAGRPRIVPEACDGCGRCVTACPAPVMAFELSPRAAPEAP